MNTSQNMEPDPNETQQSPSKIARDSGGAVFDLLDEIIRFGLDKELEQICPKVKL